MPEPRNKRAPFLRTAAASALALMLMSQCCLSAFADVITTRTEPTCTEPGQLLTEDTETHVTRAETIPATGHSFGEWLPADELHEERVCAVCGAVETRITETDAERAMPRLTLRGSMDEVNKKSRVPLEASFAGQGESFACYSLTSTQGHTTLGMEKANYTLRFYDDAEGQSKHRLRFGGWDKEHKYILKADYRDVTQCRNLVGAQLWRELVGCRESVPARIAALPTLGAVDGFPLSVWLNDEFLGLYTLCLHKDDDLFGMEDGERTAVLICNRETEDEALFRAPAVLDEEAAHDWELEYCGTEDRSWAKDSFNALIDFVMHSSDEEFRARLGAYLDVDAAIDYLIFIYALGLTDSGAKDLVLLSYGGRWIPTVYDMDGAFGLLPDGESASPPDSFLPRCEDGVWTSGTGSLLWDRLLQNFEGELRARYQTLRRGPLSEENILSAVDGFTGSIPASLYLRDAERYPGRPAADEMIEQIRIYIAERLPALDDVLGGI